MADSPLSEPPRLADVRAAHARYCERMLENKKTLMGLATCFGMDEATKYMRDVMFDNPDE